MRFPTLPVPARYLQTVDAFGGYNHNVSIPEQDFYRMKNLSSDLAPVVSPRKKRGLYAKDANVQGMIAKDSLCYVDGRDFVINGYRVDMGLSAAPEDCPKQLVSMGAYVIIFPDGKYFNTADFSDFGNLDAEFTTASSVTFTPCDLEGTEYRPDYIQSDEPKNPANLALWMDTGTKPHSLKQYSESMAMWTGIETTYVKIFCPGIGKAFCLHDGVTLSGLGGQIPQLAALEGAAVLYGQEENALTVAGILDGAVTVEVQVTVSRKMPKMDFVLEHENRLWGCRYGPNRDGQVVNELYACKLGDFRNWNCFMGISTDSYMVSLGSDGPFTGAIAQGGHPLFFKETCLHKVYGQIPANFSIQTTPCRGVQKGSGGSLAIVNDVLYYKSPHGVCAYDGSLPVEVSAPLGEEPYGQALAAALGNKYYISMIPTGTGEASLFVLDTARGLWHREDDLRPRMLCPCRGELYCAVEDGRILTLLGSGEPLEDRVSWMAETGILGATLPGRKFLTKLDIRLMLEPGSRLRILAQYDSAGPWVSLGSIAGTDLRCLRIPVKPRRCDHLRLRLEGEGNGRIFGITKIYTKGSDGV